MPLGFLNAMIAVRGGTAQTHHVPFRILNPSDRVLEASQIQRLLSQIGKRHLVGNMTYRDQQNGDFG
jgi:hypothetical protein